MADTVRELFNKKFTTSEITTGTTYNFTSDGNTAYVIKDIEGNNSSTSTKKLTATASIGLTSDLNATPSKFTNLGEVASATSNGLTGSEIMDVSSTLSIRVPAQSISYKDIVHSSLAYTSTTSITEVSAKTPTVEGVTQSAETPVVLTATSAGSNFTGLSMNGNRPNQFRVLVSNPITGVNLAIGAGVDGNSSSNLQISGYNNSTNYISRSDGYKPYDFDGRFLYNVNTNSTLKFYDTKGSASRNPTTYPHGNIDLKNAAGDSINLHQTGTTGPNFYVTYMSDVDKRYALINTASTNGIVIYELPDYTDSGTALAATGGENVATTGFWQAEDRSWTASAGGRGPNANRANPASIQNSYGYGYQIDSWFLGNSAASKTKRILVFQDGNTSLSGNKLYFFMADFDYMSQTTNNDSTKAAYSMILTELASEFGWATSTGWNGDIGGHTANIQNGQFGSLTGSDARWGPSSYFWLNQDVLYFTNVNGTNGEGPIVGWNLKTNAVHAPITWAQYDDSGGTALGHPAAAEAGNYIGHRSVAEAPSSTQINARTYIGAPSLQVRATAIKEDRS